MAELPEAQRRLTVSTQRAGGEIRLAVADRGPGIAADELAHLFEPFWSTKGSGMGLGLTICEGIIKAHNGRIWVEPNLPRGAAFLVSMPREAVDTLPRTEANLPEAPAPSPAAPS